MPGLQRSYRVYNCPAPTTAHSVFVNTGTSIKTMMQIKPTTGIIPFGWGYALDSIPTAPVYVELLTTGTVAATLTTAYVSGDIIKYGDPNSTASLITLGTTASGYTATGEGSITATDVLDVGDCMATSYRNRLELDRECGVVPTDYLRIRAHTGTAVNMLCWIDWLEQG